MTTISTSFAREAERDRPANILRRRHQADRNSADALSEHARRRAIVVQTAQRLAGIRPERNFPFG
jgi:hypothetical protein